MVSWPTVGERPHRAIRPAIVGHRVSCLSRGSSNASFGLDKRVLTKPSDLLEWQNSGALYRKKFEPLRGISFRGRQNWKLEHIGTNHRQKPLASPCSIRIQSLPRLYSFRFTPCTSRSWHSWGMGRLSWCRRRGNGDWPGPRWVGSGTFQSCWRGICGGPGEWDEDRTVKSVFVATPSSHHHLIFAEVCERTFAIAAIAFWEGLWVSRSNLASW